MRGILTSWLARTCEPLGAARIAAAQLFLDASATRADAAWPDPDDLDGDELRAAAVAAVAARRPVTRPREKTAGGTPSPGRVVAVPLPLGARHVAAVAFATPEETAAAVSDLGDAAAAAGRWLPMLLSAGDESKAGGGDALVRLLVTLLEPDEAQAANVALVSELATLFAAERVSLGFLQGGGIALEAVSHSAHFDFRTRLGRAIADAMEEALDAEAPVHWPNGPQAIANRAHRLLCEQHQLGCAISVPLVAHGAPIGALTLDYRARHPAAANVADRLARMATLLGPVLELRRRDARPLRTKLGEGLRDAIADWSGEERRAHKLVVGLALGLVLLLAVVPGTRRITATARLEGLVQRAIVAPIDGYVAESRARAGDVVAEGAVLGTLDDTELLLEQRKWTAREGELEKEYRAAVASRDRAEARIAHARLEQARAELDLVEEQLARTWLVAPFAGVVAVGDLSRELGRPLERGEVLFEIAPLDRYRIVLEVDETEIDEVEVGQPGRLKLTAQPDDDLALVVERVVPIAVSEDGRNFFRVEAALEAHDASLRPGMEGIGKIDAGRRSLLWIHTHAMLDWLRLHIWAYLP